MNEQAKKLMHSPRKKWSRVLTNRMTIVGYRLFKHSHTLHLGFIIMRLRKDFGFTLYEVANFTGIPYKTLENYSGRIRKLLESEALKILARMDYNEEKEIWFRRKRHSISKNTWFNAKRLHRELLIGRKSDKYFKEKLDGTT